MLTGTTSLGKYTLLMRLALPTKVLEVGLMTPQSKFHATMPPHVEQHRWKVRR